MEEIIDTQKGERLSFYRLFSEKGFKIQIPIIQRDYAQGRKDEKEVRTTFLDALYNYLEENIPNRDLDFIYGSLEQIGDETVFVPLDGQQRLTTLFLLHWYLYQTSDNKELKEKFESTFIKNGKSAFTYETRSSSSEFCDGLINCTGILDNLLPPDDKSANELSKTIKNCNWFFLSWKFDPTIQAMLNMLDDIHHRFCGKSVFFERLLDVENPKITFLFLNLKDFSLTDDLYIKMNSRGKPLSTFENFKAKFEQSLDNVNVGGRIFEKNYDVDKQSVSLREYFSFNIDTKWADLFWNYRNIKTSDNNFDDEFVNFIRAIFTSQYAVENPDTEHLKELTSKLPSDRFTYPKYCDLDIILDKEKETKLKVTENIDEEKIKELKKIFSDCALFLVDILDALTNGSNKIMRFISDDYRFYYDEVKAFEKALKNDFQSNAERLRFFAYTKFLIINKNDKSGINEWMRVIHNITHPDNMPIDDIDNFVKAAKSINSMLPYSGDILQYLSNNNNTIGFFNSGLILEERIKAQLIKKSNIWKYVIENHNAEKHGYFNGQIGFLLEFSGIWDYYTSHYRNCNWTAEEDSVFFAKFKDYSVKAAKVFADNYKTRVDKVPNYVFERAVLTKGDYFISGKSEWPKNMLTTAKDTENIKRSYSWKRLLRLPDGYTDTFKNKRQYVKQVFDDERFVTNDFYNSLKTICKDRTGDLKRDFLIDTPLMMDYSEQGFIGYDGDIYTIYRQSRLNHYHVEFFTYHLYLKCRQYGMDVQYNELRYSGYLPSLYTFVNANRRKHEIKIVFYDDEYEIELLRNDGKCSESDFSDEVKRILSVKKYVWYYEDDEYKYFGRKFKTEDETYQGLCDLLEDLQTI